VLEFEKRLYEKLDTTYLELANKIKIEQKLTDEIEENMKKVINETIDELI